MLSLRLVKSQFLNSCTMQDALKFSETESSWHWAFVKLSIFNCSQVVGTLYEKLDCTSLNELSCEKAAKKLISSDNSFHLHSRPQSPPLPTTWLYTERNFQTATRHFLIYLNMYDTYMAKIYTQYGKIN